MDIFLSEVSNKSSSFTFQSLPERIKTKFGTKYQNYDIISKGTVKIPRGLEAETISWDGTFYGKSKRNEVMIREWTSPAECVKVLRNWMIKGTVLRLLVTETNINYDVTISDFEPIETGAYGNIDYSITSKYYGSGTSWQKIYSANSSTIEATAKRYRGGRGSDNGHWIYPGTVLTIP